MTKSLRRVTCVLLAASSLTLIQPPAPLVARPADRLPSAEPAAPAAARPEASPITEFSALRRHSSRAGGHQARREAHARRRHHRGVRYAKRGRSAARVAPAEALPQAQPFAFWSAAADASAPTVRTRRGRIANRGSDAPRIPSFGGSDVVAEARRYIGTNPTNRRSLWCGRFMNLVLERTGHHGSGSDLARSFASYGRRVSGPEVGAIAVMARHGGGHVGVVSGIDERGNPIIISGNHGHRVAESTYPRGRIYAYVMPGA